MTLDDEEFIDTEETELRPIPEVTLPSGITYKSRTIAGLQDLAWVRKCRDLYEHILFYGPPGTGKTMLAEAAFFSDAKPDTTGGWEHLGMETIVCSVDTTESDFLGTFIQDPATGNFIWVKGPLQRAVEQGIPIYVDEIFLADPRVLASTLYPLMDGRRTLRIPANPTLPEMQPAKGFFVIAAGNPDVPGANFSEALRDRFDHHVEITTDWELARSLGVPGSMVDAAMELDVLRQQKTISWSPQLRSLVSFRNSIAPFGLKYAVSNLIGKAPFEDRAAVLGVVQDKYPALKGVEVLQLGSQYQV